MFFHVFSWSFKNVCLSAGLYSVGIQSFLEDCLKAVKVVSHCSSHVSMSPCLCLTLPPTGVSEVLTHHDGMRWIFCSITCRDFVGTFLRNFTNLVNFLKLSSRPNAPLWIPTPTSAARFRPFFPRNWCYVDVRDVKKTKTKSQWTDQKHATKRSSSNIYIYIPYIFIYIYRIMYVYRFKAMQVDASLSRSRPPCDFHLEKTLHPFSKGSSWFFVVVVPSPSAPALGPWPRCGNSH